MIIKQDKKISVIESQEINNLNINQNKLQLNKQK